MTNPFQAPAGGAVAVIEQAAQLLAQGRLVAFPTETVYGLGADAASEQAVAGIFAAKGRPADHPLIVHVAPGADLTPWAHVNERARKLIAAFWPGPLTLILPKTAAVPDAVTGGQPTVGLRCPSHPVAQALLSAFAQLGSGLVAAPSANSFGRISPTQAAHVHADLGSKVDLIVDGGDCDVGVESTIVDLSGDAPRLLRPGMVMPQAIEAVLGERLLAPAASGPKVSGMLDKHYAPTTPTRLIAEQGLAAFGPLAGRKVLALAIDGALVHSMLAQSGAEFSIMPMPADPVEYARALYAALHQADASGADLILIEQPPVAQAWDAIQDLSLIHI